MSVKIRSFTKEGREVNGLRVIVDDTYAGDTPLSLTLSGAHRFDIIEAVIPAEPPAPGSSVSIYEAYWKDNFRVDTDLLAYIGANFDSSGLFTHLWDSYLKVLGLIPWSAISTYKPILWTWKKPSYLPGEPIGGGILETLAHRVVNPGQSIQTAVNSLGTNEWLVYVRPGTYNERVYISRSNVVIVGAGWSTIIRLPDNTPLPSPGGGPENGVVFIGYGRQNVIVCDLTIDGNMANNPDIEWKGVSYSEHTNCLVENVKFVNCRRYGPYSNASKNVYWINNYMSNIGWNAGEPARSSFIAGVGNFCTGYRDVGLSTWGSHDIFYANNVCCYPKADGKGYNDANWGIGVEPQSGYDSYRILLLNDICCEHMAGPSPTHESPLGEGIWIMGYGMCYSIVVDRCITRNNQRWGVRFEPDTLDAKSIVTKCDARSCCFSYCTPPTENIDDGGRPGVILRDNITE